MQSTDIYSIGGYHHAFVDAGYRFNFADLLPNVPASAYFLPLGAGGGCDAVDQNWDEYVDWVNGQPPGRYGGICNTILDAAYSPTLLVPLQIRTLDAAWSTCDLNLGGLYDPPRALTEQLTVPAFSYPPTKTTSTATPAHTALADDGPSSTTPAAPSTQTPTALQQTAAYAGTSAMPLAEPSTPGQPGDDPSIVSTAIESQWTALPESESSSQDMGQIILSMLAPAESMLGTAAMDLSSPLAGSGSWSSSGETLFSDLATTSSQSPSTGRMPMSTAALPSDNDGSDGLSASMPSGGDDPVSAAALTSDVAGGSEGLLSTSLRTGSSIPTDSGAANSNSNLAPSASTSTSTVIPNSAQSVHGMIRPDVYLLAVLGLFGTVFI
nr:hypothetical protein CFP56_78065 [Quercus suber]